MRPDLLGEVLKAPIDRMRGLNTRIDVHQKSAVVNERLATEARLELRELERDVSLQLSGLAHDTGNDFADRIEFEFLASCVERSATVVTDIETANLALEAMKEAYTSPHLLVALAGKSGDTSPIEGRAYRVLSVNALPMADPKVVRLDSHKFGLIDTEDDQRDPVNMSTFGSEFKGFKSYIEHPEDFVLVQGYDDIAEFLEILKNEDPRALISIATSQYWMGTPIGSEPFQFGKDQVRDIRKSMVACLARTQGKLLTLTTEEGNLEIIHDGSRGNRSSYLHSGLAELFSHERDATTKLYNGLVNNLLSDEARRRRFGMIYGDVLDLEEMFAESAILLAEEANRATEGRFRLMGGMGIRVVADPDSANFTTFLEAHSK